MPARLKPVDDISGYVLSSDLADHYGLTQVMICNLLRKHPRAFVRHYNKSGTGTKMLFAYKKEGVHELINAYLGRIGKQKKTDIAVEKEERTAYNSLPDLELFRKYAQEFRKETNQFWG